MSKYCRYCGKELADHALFCSGCGKPVGSYVPETPKPSYKAPEPNKGSVKKSLSEKRESARARKEEARRKKAEKKAAKKKKSWFGGINFLLVLALLIETAVAGFKWPGYFVKQPGGLVPEVIARLTEEDLPSEEELLRDLENANHEDLINVEYEITKESSPGNPALIETTWSEEEIKESEAEEQSFRWDNAEAVVNTSNGQVKAQFNCWDLNEDEDALIVRTLGKKHDAASEMTLYGYDLSLASGQHEFTSHNVITIPRMSSDDRDSYVAYYNPDTGKYENVCFDITEDRKSYLVYLDHFSTVAEVIPDYLKPAFFGSNIFYEPEYEQAMPVMDRKIAFSHAGYEEWSKKNIIDLVKLAEEGLSYDDYASVGLGLLDYQGLPGSLREIGYAAKKTGIFEKFVDNLGYITITLTALNQARYDKGIVGFLEVFKKDKWALGIDLAMSILSSIGKKAATDWAAAATATAGGATIFLPLGILLCGISITYTTHGLLQITMKLLGEPPIPDAYPRMDTYQTYLLQESALVHFDNNVWEVALSGLKAYDAESDTYIDSMYMMVRDIMLKYKNDPELVKSALEQVTTEYARYFWNGLSENERANYEGRMRFHKWQSTFGRKRMKYYNDTAQVVKDQQMIENLKKNWKDPDNDTINEYTDMHMAYVQKNVNERVRAVERDQFIKTRLLFESIVQNEIVPMLNERIVFSVVDPSAKTFDQSKFSGYEKGKRIQDYEKDMWFMRGNIRTANDMRLGNLLCKPANLNKKDYTAESVQPYPRENSNVVYSCTRYHYMQMGAPNRLILRVNNYSDNIRLQIGKLPPAGKNGVVDVELKLNPDLSVFSGVWVPMSLKDKYDNREDISKEWVLALLYIEGENTFMEYEGPANNYMNENRWIYVKSFNYDAKTRELTINFSENSPRGIDTATFTIDKNDRMTMVNSGGPFQFFRSGDRY